MNNNTLNLAKDKLTTYVKANKKSILKLAILSAVLSCFTTGMIVNALRAAGGYIEHMTANPFKIMYYGIFFKGSFPIFLLFTLAFFVIFNYVKAMLFLRDQEYDPRGFAKAKDGVYGTADFMQLAEKEEVFHESDDITRIHKDIVGVDKDNGKIMELRSKKKGDVDEDRSYNNMKLIAGTSGTGKSVGEMIPNIIQQTLRGESIIMTDLKGELYGLLGKWQENKGYTVKVLNLIDPLRSDAFNVMSLIKGDTLMAENLAESLIENTLRSNKGKDDVFFVGSKALLSFGILHMSMNDSIEEKDRTLGAVYDFILTHTVDDFEAMAAEMPVSNPAKKQWLIFKTMSENLRGNVFANMLTSLHQLSMPQIQAITGYDEIDLTLPGKEKCAYYVMMPQGGGTFNYFAAVFFTFLLDRLTHYSKMRPDGKLRVPVNLMLDEFANVGRIPGFENGLATWRSMDIRCTIALQNLEQLQSMYDPITYSKIMDLFDEQLYLGTNSPVDAKYWSDRTGVMTIRAVSERVDKKMFRPVSFDQNTQQNVGAGKRNVMTPDEVQHMSRRFKLVFITMHRVIQVRKFYYWNHPAAKELIKSSWMDRVPAWWEAEKDVPWFKKAKQANEEEYALMRAEWEADMAKGRIDGETMEDIIRREEEEDAVENNTKGNELANKLKEKAKTIAKAAGTKIRTGLGHGLSKISEKLLDGVSAEGERVFGENGDKDAPKPQEMPKERNETIDEAASGPYTQDESDAEPSTKTEPEKQSKGPETWQEPQDTMPVWDEPDVDVKPQENNNAKPSDNSHKSSRWEKKPHKTFKFGKKDEKKGKRETKEPKNNDPEVQPKPVVKNEQNTADTPVASQTPPKVPEKPSVPKAPEKPSAPKKPEGMPKIVPPEPPKPRTIQHSALDELPKKKHKTLQANMDNATDNTGGETL